MLSIPPGRNPAPGSRVRNWRARRPIRRRSVLHPGEACPCGQLRLQAPEETSGIFAMAMPRGLRTPARPRSPGASRPGVTTVTRLPHRSRRRRVPGRRMVPSPPVKCASCGHDNPAGARFCNSCGAPLVASAVTPEPRAYTPRHLVEKILASRSALRGERKLVTVLFADVARSMELAERIDAEEWHRLLDRLFRILADGVHRYEGTINQYTGDGIMALFGAPIAHEDHAQRACAAAVDLARELRALADDVRRESGLELAVRMGLNSTRWWWDASATTCAWTTPRRATSSASPPGSSSWPRPAARR